MEALHRQVLPFLLRRVKEDVLQDLPPKIIQDYQCDLSPLQVGRPLAVVTVTGPTLAPKSLCEFSYTLVYIRMYATYVSTLLKTSLQGTVL